MTHSFAITFLRKTIFANPHWFCDVLPPTTRGIEGKKSIQDALENIELSFQEPVTKTLKERFIQGTTLSVHMLALCFFVAPLGLLWHGMHAMGYSIELLRNKENEYEYNWMKIEQHAKAFFADLCVSFLFLSVFLQITSLSVLFMTSICLCGVFPKVALLACSILFTSEDKSALFKSLALYRDCGIVTHEGKLLHYDKEIDRETSSLTGYWGEVLKINMLKAFFIEHMFGSECDRDDTIESFLESLRNDPAGKDYESCIKEISQMLERAERNLNQSLGICLDFKQKAEDYASETLPEDEELTGLATTWKNLLDQHSQFLNVGNGTCLPEYHALKEKIVKHKTPFDFLGFNHVPKSKKEVKEHFVTVEQVFLEVFRHNEGLQREASNLMIYAYAAAKVINSLLFIEEDYDLPQLSLQFVPCSQEIAEEEIRDFVQHVEQSCAGEGPSIEVFNETQDRCEADELEDSLAASPPSFSNISPVKFAGVNDPKEDGAKERDGES